MSAGATPAPNRILTGIFGSGSDGDVIVSAPLVLTRDMFYRNLTIAAGAAISGPFKIFVNGMLDLRTAPAGAFNANGLPGNNATSSAAVPATVSAINGTIIAGQTGSASPAGGTAAGSQATTVNPAHIGGNCGLGGAGGAGSGGAGGIGRAGATNVTMTWNRIDATVMRGNTFLIAGQGATGGSSGGGDGTAGGGGGGAGVGAGIVFIWARSITCTGAAAGAIQAKGGAGGNGFSNIAGVRGGGGGAPGAGGGWVYVVCEQLTGTAANIFDVSGGLGGNGGNGFGGGAAAGGVGGQGGYGGRVTVIKIAADICTESDGTAIAGTAGNNNTGMTGGTGGAGAVVRFNL